jgi:hypothetical protein
VRWKSRSSRRSRPRSAGSLRCATTSGYALHQLGRYDEALAEFRQARLLRERAGDAGALRDARWMEAWTLRALKRIDEAIAIQTRLETEYAAAGAPNHDVFEELELLYRAKGDSPAGDALRRAQGHGTALRGGSSKRRPKSRSTTTARCCQRCRSSFDFERARRPGTLPSRALRLPQFTRGCDTGAGGSGWPPGPPAKVSGDTASCWPTPGLLQSHTPVGKTALSRESWPAVKATGAYSAAFSGFS